MYAFHHPPKNWCGRRESHPHELAPTGISGRRVCCSATSAESGSGTETCAPLFPIPTGCVASYALPAWSRRKDLHLRSPRGLRVYSALHLLLCHVSKTGGSGGSRTRIDTAYETVALLLCYRAKMVGRLGEAKRSGQPAGWGQGPEREARVKCSEFCRLRAGCFTVKAYDPWKWWSLRVSHPSEFLPARETTTLRSPRPKNGSSGRLRPCTSALTVRRSAG